MPGDTPREAFNAFIKPLQSAVRCLGPGKIVTSAGGKDAPGRVHAWTLNGPAGFSRGGAVFEAQMHYEIIQDSRPDYGPWRVTTRAYRYKIGIGGADVARIHWHPVGNSPYRAPHLHLAMALPARLGEIPPDTIGRHMPSPRYTFESAIAWAAELGMPMERDDWREILGESEEKHLEFRTWDQGGPESPRWPEQALPVD